MINVTNSTNITNKLYALLYLVFNKINVLCA